jgi:hypothetical protein
MSQPQNLRADELQHPTPVTPLAAVPQTQASSDDVAGRVSIATPRLWSVDSQSAHTVPATVRSADSMIDGALALRLQAITRLGVVSAPTTLTTLAALTSAPPQASDAAGDDHLRIQATVAEARMLAAAPAAGTAVAAGESTVPEPMPVTLPEPVPVTVPVPAEAGDGSVALKAAGHKPVTPESSEGAGAAPTPGPERKLVAVPADEAGATAAVRGGAGVPAADPTAVPGGGVAPHGAVGGPGVPDAQAWAGRLVQAVSEVLAGDRPISQLVRFADEAVFADLNRRVRMLGLSTTATSRGARERSAVRSVRVCTPARHVAEVAAHVRHGDRSRAIALRMEIRRHRWVCTALVIG